MSCVKTLISIYLGQLYSFTSNKDKLFDTWCDHPRAVWDGGHVIPLELRIGVQVKGDFVTIYG